MKDQMKYYQDKLNYEMDSADLFESLERGEEIVIVDARKEFAYHEEHIPGAINLPHRKIDKDSTKSLNKNFIYISYCDGIGCNASTKGALKLAQLGFNVKELIGGIDWWKRDRYATEGDKAVKGAQVQCAC